MTLKKKKKKRKKVRKVAEEPQCCFVCRDKSKNEPLWASYCYCINEE